MYMHNLKTIGRSWTYYIPNDCPTIGDIFVWFRVVWEIQLTSYGPRHVSWSFSDTTLCILQAHTYITIWCATTRQQNSHSLWPYYTPTTDLLPMMHRFIRTTCKCYVMTYKLLQSIASTYTLQCLSNYMHSGDYKYMCTNIKLIRSTTILLNKLSTRALVHCNEFAEK